MSEFYARAASKDGRQNWCKTCTNEKNKQRKAEVRLLVNQHKTGLAAYTPRELMIELYKRGYVGKLEYTRKEIIDISKLED